MSPLRKFSLEFGRDSNLSKRTIGTSLFVDTQDVEVSLLKPAVSTLEVIFTWDSRELERVGGVVDK